MEDLNKIGVVIDRHGSWRETVIYYARHRNRISAAIKIFDECLERGMAEPWAALRALDDTCCADIISDKQIHPIRQLMPAALS